MSARVREHATYEDLLRVPENMVAELIEGELFASPRPRGSHNNASAVLGAFIVGAFQLGVGGPGGWWIHHEPELHPGENVLVPDIGGWRRERMPEYPKSHIYSIPPDWVCEVLSQSTARLDRAKKLPIYARNGVQYAWVVDVGQQYLEVKRLQDGRWHDVAVFTTTDKIHAEPFEAIEIDMTLVWGPPPA